MKCYHIKVLYTGQLFSIASIPFEDNSVAINFEFNVTKTIEVKGHYYRPKKELTWNAHEISKNGYRELSVDEICVIVEVIE